MGRASRLYSRVMRILRRTGTGTGSELGLSGILVAVVVVMMLLLLTIDVRGHRARKRRWEKALALVS